MKKIIIKTKDGKRAGIFYKQIKGYIYAQIVFSTFYSSFSNKLSKYDSAYALECRIYLSRRNKIAEKHYSDVLKKFIKRVKFSDPCMDRDGEWKIDF